jgi:hypothetical protein
MTNTKMNRRNFLKAAGVTSLFILPVVSSPNAFAEGRGGKASSDHPTLVSDSDPQAVSVGYKSDAAKVDLKKWNKRAGPEGAKQFCYNCQLYQSNSADPKSSKSSPCLLFPGKSVSAKGWCNSWTQNPKVMG